MFKKLLAKVGIGAATVDTRLNNDSFFPGEIIDGEVYITGGDVEQEIKDIYLYIATEYKREVDDTTVTETCELVKYSLCDTFTIAAKETQIISFAIPLPYQTPLTIKNQPVYLRTGLDVSLAVDPKDIDYINVYPHPLIQLVIDAIQNLGFHLHEVTCDYHPHLGGNYPFVQEFEFRPTGKYQGHLDELEVIFSLNPDELNVIMEIDKRGRGLGGFLAEAFDMDEKIIRFQVTPDYLDYPENLEANIDEIIASHI
ncbi:MAG TPA: sporulation protein SpoOM [Cyanobacteria bacterium UBA11149]|nr:sporulation protein SpoOM [Cyanobacteria bacterium UBA11367]HBE57091.1 sporulation protein SpoOM [Cyanobacteria bacterium UBA11366]HBK65923.1 sporulation protein SpoOM [Cyanobacteria bacterium UBA11166]HBR75289.1 sporulation protein SpoOM [Cyanobacteria bacterium UBA11159]HBS71438.1 sporulation protein SpoOM [Cyanobacteria bacterium UBA11153]HBW88799.1 sporulation protein SpoOM [Cyanobacteria bacterium UBA11149]HCA96933.1 sporulation protein SpoOM [Cyanobacteria bacterium UBA9226]